MDKQTFSAITTFIITLTFLSSIAYCDSADNDLYDSYLKASDAEKPKILESLTSRGDAGLPSLKKMLKKSLERSHREYEDVLSAISRVGTEKAAIVLRNEATRSKKIDPSVPIKYLAYMGKTGLKQLITLTEKNELTLSSKTLMPHILSTTEASRAKDALAWIHDPAAAADLVTLISNTWLRIPALKALTNMKAPGCENQALALWENRLNWRQDRGYALGYLLSVDRSKYLPLLQKELRSFDAAVLLRDNPDSGSKRARGPLDFFSENLLYIIFYAGGDHETAQSLSLFAESRLWDRHDERRDHEQIFIAILDLGLSRSPQAKSTLLHFLKEDLLIKPRIDGFDNIPSYEHPQWPWFDKYQRGINKEDGFPICAVAAIALGELGDPTAIPFLEEAAKNNPDLKAVFDIAISMLRKCAGENRMCGGLAGILCCPGLTCNYNGNHPDAGGICKPE